MTVVLILLAVVMLLTLGEEPAPEEWTRDAWDTWKRRHGITHHL